MHWMVLHSRFSSHGLSGLKPGYRAHLDHLPGCGSSTTRRAGIPRIAASAHRIKKYGGQGLMPKLIEQAVATLTNTLADNVRTAADVLGVDAQELYRQVCTHAAKEMAGAPAKRDGS
jgi:hypothetical protein